MSFLNFLGLTISAEKNLLDGKNLLKEIRELKNEIKDLEEKNKILEKQKKDLEESLIFFKKENKNLNSIIRKLNVDESILHQNSKKRVDKFINQDISINPTPLIKNSFNVSLSQNHFIMKTSQIQIEIDFSENNKYFEKIEQKITNISNCELIMQKVEFVSTIGISS